LTLSKIQNQSREDLFEQLELMSSEAKQLDYKLNVPIAYVSNELFWGWYSVYTEIKELDWFSGIYSEKELNILDDFEVEICRIRASLPENLPPITELILFPEWKQIIVLAKQTLIKLNEFQ